MNARFKLKSKIARGLVATLLVPVAVVLASGGREASAADHSKTATDVSNASIERIEDDPVVAVFSLLGPGAAAALRWAELQGVAAHTEQVLLTLCRSPKPMLLDDSLPLRFAPLAEALGMGALLSNALVPLLTGRPGKPALAGTGAWLGAWVGYLLGVRSYALSLLAPEEVMPFMTRPALTVSLTWEPQESSRLWLSVEGIGGSCLSKRSQAPSWVLWTFPVLGATVGALLGYALGE